MTWRGAFLSAYLFTSTGAGAASSASAEIVGVASVIDGDTLEIRGERILFHVPGGRDYARTRVDENKGERWFCSEEEALKAGWRKSVR